jgi:FMN phosphatase YigB (HAD superfamily)
MSLPHPPVRYLAIDIDHCLVRYDDNYVPYVTDAIIDTVLQLDTETRNVFKGDRDLVEQLANQYYTQYGQSILGFAFEHHMNVGEMSERYHAQLDPTKFINPTEEQFNQLNQFTSWLLKAERDGTIDGYVALTQSTSSWAKKVLHETLGLRKIFNDQNIISSDKYGYGFKHNDVRPYSAVMCALNSDDKREILVIDDSRSVLRYAFQERGMQTCLISHGAAVGDEHRSYLSIVANNIGEVPRLVAELSR